LKLLTKTQRYCYSVSSIVLIMNSALSMIVFVLYACMFEACSLRLNDRGDGPGQNIDSISGISAVQEQDSFNSWGEVFLVGENVSRQEMLSDVATYNARMLSLTAAPILLVLARYKEDVNWVFDTGIPTLIMNRGEHIDSRSGEVSEQLEYSNVNRESFLYLQYILSNYDTKSFPDTVAFCQAEPTYFGNTKKILLDDVRNLRSLSIGQHMQQKPFNPRWNDISADIQNDGFAFLGTTMYKAAFGENDQRIKQMSSLFQEFMPGCNILDQHFTPGGCIAVTRSQILSKSKDWYEKLIRIGNDQNRPMIGFATERTWACIFTKPGRQCICDGRE